MKQNKINLLGKKTKLLDNEMMLLTSLLTPWSRVLLETLTVNFAASQEIPRIYGTRKFLSVPQVPATCPYPEPTPSSPHDPLQLPEDPS
jgi:hypothetical protein